MINNRFEETQMKLPFLVQNVCTLYQDPFVAIEV